MPNEDELIVLRDNYAKELAEHRRSSDEAEKALQTARLSLLELTQMPAASTESPPDLQVQHLRDRLAGLDLLISSARVLESLLQREALQDGVSLELQLEQAGNHLSRLVQALNTEAHVLATAQSEATTIASNEGRVTEYSEQLDRMGAASDLIKDLLQQAKEGVFADEVMRANAVTIGTTFASIHAPNEFEVSTDVDGALTITREGTSEAVSLQQMSTGQRAAYALSLFFSMNHSLVSAPPLILMDDPIAHVDDLNILSFLDHLRDVAVGGSRQIFLATADDKLAGLFRQKFRFLGEGQFVEHVLSRT